MAGEILITEVVAMANDIAEMKVYIAQMQQDIAKIASTYNSSLIALNVNNVV